MRLEDHFSRRPFQSKKILLVDDEKEIGWIFSRIAKDAGHRCMLAYTFKEGMYKFRRSKNIDVVLIDFKLDRKDGLEFIREARAVNDKPLFIMISAFGNPELRKEAREAGAGHFLDKPFKPENVLRMIN